ncbi:hypothetical protein BKA03_002885 [Demequina lutea]|uniref:Uncharacterized protein n=1 Tax=Demequina lutea TaxID=431489 RepID=A0A7Z0CIN5_9MICO|nr:hypothetical protein [Demequina lutea]
MFAARAVPDRLGSWHIRVNAAAMRLSNPQIPNTLSAASAHSGPASLGMITGQFGK